MSNIELLNKLLESTVWLPINGYENFMKSVFVVKFVILQLNEF